MMKKIRVIIIDDERSAREELKRLILNFPELEIVGEAKNADDAQMEIELKHPDLLFLDIQMPGKTGFDLLESLNDVPAIIFTTAFDQYAVKAFEVGAMDYLMKPIREERFSLAIEKIKMKIGQVNDSHQIFVKDRDEYHLVRWKQVHLIESMDNYARIYFGDKKVFLKSSLNQLEQKLDGTLFFRINRAQIINTLFINKISTTSSGRLEIRLSSGEILEVSERQSVKLKKMGKV
ncbi:LytR/AlgR family response regulator transcription factor [Pedobacter cryoconitis]|uniref:Two-component system LytT family response regulator n=1 Tax=Pedobacter cryoconitis TaxID=188932 RepID=A0A7X0J047_9SPHI|nr:response regulator transcription factor [Pedobacter cryoconitis]MBB6498052.1 two-component system LytT family response regulator [Pedobacter cryoconitis]